MELHNTLAESHERVLALQDELAGERGRKKAIENALKQRSRLREVAETSSPPGLFSFWFGFQWPCLILVDCVMVKFLG